MAWSWEFKKGWVCASLHWWILQEEEWKWWIQGRFWSLVGSWTQVECVSETWWWSKQQHCRGVNVNNNWNPSNMSGQSYIQVITVPGSGGRGDWGQTTWGRPGAGGRGHGEDGDSPLVIRPPLHQPRLCGLYRVLSTQTVVTVNIITVGGWISSHFRLSFTQKYFCKTFPSFNN